MKQFSHYFFLASAVCQSFRLSWKLLTNIRSKGMFTFCCCCLRSHFLIWSLSLRAGWTSCSAHILVFVVPVAYDCFLPGAGLWWLLPSAFTAVVFPARWLRWRMKVCWPPQLSQSPGHGVIFRCHCFPVSLHQLWCNTLGTMWSRVVLCQPVRLSGGTQARRLPYAFSLKGGRLSSILSLLLILLRSQPHFYV